MLRIVRREKDCRRRRRRRHRRRILLRRRHCLVGHSWKTRIRRKIDHEIYDLLQVSWKEHHVYS